ncbi:aminodeoxychorismate/anthranilate synthase component II [Candidatus Pelagibacter sp.]|nr:aminodeoxychorismate/anthranilate synthase component II [Candidatus Pelagibacter sp.]
MIYVIDHKDSFTHNVVHQLSLFDQVLCDDFSKVSKSKLNQASTIVFSPGPGSPKDYPISSKIYKKFKGKKKIIGICLGFQQILYCEGANIIEQKKIYHGFQSEVLVNKSSKLFSNGQKFKVGRYHSLKLKEPFKAENFDITMRCAISETAMSFENNIDKIYGFQFHPESFLTINGKILIKKILSA